MKPAAILLALSLAAFAQADVLFNQSALNGNSFDITDYRLADDFTLAANATLQELRFWYQAQYQSDLAVVSYAFYSDSASKPGAVLASDTVMNPATGFDPVSGLFFADLTLTPLPLASSTRYRLELHAGTGLTDTAGYTISWAATDDSTALSADENLLLGTPGTPVDISGYNQYAFQLQGAAIPEPASIRFALLAVCVAALHQARQRARSRRI